MNLSRLHTMMIRQLHIPIYLYVKHARLYNVKHRLNTSAYRCRPLYRHSDISTSRSRGCRLYLYLFSGGCFEQGPGWIDSFNGYLTFRTDIMKINHTYEFKVIG